jgi:predicted DNA repair protein MutK
MATSLLALLDDITTVLDDVALLAKVAAKKTTGVLGDDLALNAHQVAGIRAERELPVVWSVAKGSLKNKAMLVPSALLLSAAAPWAVTPLLMCGGLYLCYEGFEKLAHKYLQSANEAEEARAARMKALSDPAVDLVAFEEGKIAGAIRTDFILSGEIIVITMGAVAGASFVTRAGVLAAVAVLMTAFVYGFVAVIVKLDDMGLHLTRRKQTAAFGRFLLLAAPALMKALSVAGTVAMFMVGGGILIHGLPGAYAAIHRAAAAAGPLRVLVPSVLDALAGVIAGAAALAVVSVSARAARRAGRR